MKTVELLFFLDETHDLSSFLMQELGIMRWPSYKQRISRSVFPDSSSLEAYSHALRQETALEAAIRKNALSEIERLLEPAWKVLSLNLHKAPWTGGGPRDALPNDVSFPGKAPPLFLARFSATWVYVRMATEGVTFLEKRKRHEKCVELLRCLLGGNACPSKRGLWWTRLIIDLQTLKRHRAALESCKSALADSWVRHGDRIAIQRQLLKLCKRLKIWKLPGGASRLNRKLRHITIHATPLNCDQGYKSQFRGRDGDVVGVEQLALEFFEEEGHGSWRGVHTEGTLWRTLFGVLFWDVIFAGPITD